MLPSFHAAGWAAHKGELAKLRVLTPPSVLSAAAALATLPPRLPLPRRSELEVSREIAKSLNLLFGGIDMDPTGGCGAPGLGALCWHLLPAAMHSHSTRCQLCCVAPTCLGLHVHLADRLLGVYLVSERQHRRREEDVLRALQEAGECAECASNRVQRRQGSVPSAPDRAPLASRFCYAGACVRSTVCPPFTHPLTLCPPALLLPQDTPWAPAAAACTPRSTG